MSRKGFAKELIKHVFGDNTPKSIGRFLVGIPSRDGSSSDVVVVLDEVHFRARTTDYRAISIQGGKVLEVEHYAPTLNEPLKPERIDTYTLGDGSYEIETRTDRSEKVGRPSELGILTMQAKFQLQIKAYEEFVENLQENQEQLGR